VCTNQFYDLDDDPPFDIGPLSGFFKLDVWSLILVEEVLLRRSVYLKWNEKRSQKSYVGWIIHSGRTVRPLRSKIPQWSLPAMGADINSTPTPLLNYFFVRPRFRDMSSCRRRGRKYFPSGLLMKNTSDPYTESWHANGNNSLCNQLIGLHVQSVVACVFSLQGWLEGLYGTLGELAKNYSHSPLPAMYETK
jgi:hypothetical protein